MSLAATTIAPKALLTTLARVKAALELTSTADDVFLTDKVRAASDAISAFCRRIFPRQVYQEVAGAQGGIEFLCAQAPVVALGTVSFDGTVLTDVTIQDAEVGTIYRKGGFDWTAQRFAGLGASMRGLDFGTPLPLQEEPLWTVDYTAGFIMPGQNLISVATVSVALADQSFNDSASGFPALLKAGDVIETSGFDNAANNGRFLVSGTPTAAKIVVTGGALVLEAAAAGRTVLVQSLPSDVEQATIETVVSMYANRATDGNIVEKQAGLMRLRYSEQGANQQHVGLPGVAASRLRRWLR